jgi:hypothetical protein
MRKARSLSLIGLAGQSRRHTSDGKAEAVVADFYWPGSPKASNSAMRE